MDWISISPLCCVGFIAATWLTASEQENRTGPNPKARLEGIAEKAKQTPEKDGKAHDGETVPLMVGTETGAVKEGSFS